MFFSSKKYPLINELRRPWRQLIEKSVWISWYDYDYNTDWSTFETIAWLISLFYNKGLKMRSGYKALNMEQSEAAW